MRQFAKIEKEFKASNESLMVSAEVGELEVEVEEELQDDKVPSTSYFLKQRPVVINLVLMSMLWLSSAFGYYLILSLINTFDEVYVTGLISSASEIIATAIAGFAY